MAGGDEQPVYTGSFVIVAADTVHGEVGVAILSSSIGGAAVSRWADARYGAVVTLGGTELRLGGFGFNQLRHNGTPDAVRDAMRKEAAQPETGQWVVLDVKGRAAFHTGRRAAVYAGGAGATGFRVQAVGVSGPEVVDLAAVGFHDAVGSLAERLAEALREAEETAGKKMQFRSAALLVVKRDGGVVPGSQDYVDLRVDDSPRPSVELERMLGELQRERLPGVHTRLGDAALARGDREEAEREYACVIRLYRQAIEASPNDPVPRNGLAWFFAQHRVNLDEAYLLAREAHDLAPRSWQILDTLAEITLARGRYGDAHAQVLRALELSPENDYLQAKAERVQARMVEAGRR